MNAQLIKYIMNNGDNPIILLPSIKEASAGEARSQWKFKGHYRSNSHVMKVKGSLINDVSIRNRSQDTIPSLAKHVGEYRFLSRYKNHEESRYQLQSTNITKGSDDIQYNIPSKKSEKSSISNRPKVQTQFMTIEDHHFSNRNIINSRKTEEQLRCRIKSKILKFKSMLRVEQKTIRNVEDAHPLANIVNVKCFYNKANQHSTAYQTQISKSQIRIKRQQRKPPIFKIYRNIEGKEAKYPKITSIDGWNFQKDDFQ